MDDNRVGAYLELIQALLNCPSGEEAQILQANSELVDAGLVEVMERVAKKMAADENRNAGWLRQLAAKIARMLGMATSATPQEYWQFLMQVLRATAESDGNPEVVYPLLQANLDKLDDGLTQILQAWVTQKLSEVEPQQAQFIAADLVNFGNLIQQFPFGNTASNMEMAIAAYEKALEVYTRQAFSQDWAMTQNNLGNAYSDRIRGERAQNLEEAIAAYEKALQVLTRQAFPENWAMTQNNLGNAYKKRIWGERTQNLEEAIAAYEKALQVLTRQAFPQNWAMTQNNLAAAYSNRIRGERAQNLEEAIAAYEKALEVYTRQAFPENWATTQNNLGNAYCDRIRGERAQNLEEAIAAYEKALEVYTRQAFPQDWAMTQNNLGNAYKNRIRGERAQNLEEAIAAYEKALEVYTRQAFPQDWAMTQNNLGNTYKNRIRGERAQNLEEAIAAYEKALQVRTHEAFPENHTETLFNLGLIYQKQQQWQQAYDTFCTAIETVESLREEILSGEESKQKFAEEWNPLYSHLVEACLKLTKLMEALEYAERSKTRNLVEQILLRDSHTIFPSDVANELTRLRDDIATAQYQIQQGNVENYAELAQRLQDLRQQRNQLQDEYLRVGSGFQFHSFQETLDSHTVVIEWYLTGETCLAFIITKDTVPVIWQSTPDDKKALVNWTATYLQTYTERDTWRNQLTDALQNLAQILHLDELLAHLPPFCQRLILIPHRFLHLLPLHALPVSSETAARFLEPHPTVGYADGCPKIEPHYLLDIFPKGVSYAPSCQLLQQVQTRQRPDFDTLFAIQTPTSDLYEKDLGAVEVIQKQFANSDILQKEKATKSTLLPEDKATQTLTQYEKLQTAHSLFFFGHGYFNPNSPLDSGLQLADDNLTLAEIILHFRLDSCRLVTLSACETGLVDFNNSSDEYIGLPNGFLIAGSRAVLSSLWTVQSLSTALLVVRVYQNLKLGQSLAVALQQAQSWLRNATKTDLEAWGKKTLPNANHRRQLKIFLRQQETEKPFASPYHWAAFCAVGE